MERTNELGRIYVEVDENGRVSNCPVVLGPNGEKIKLAVTDVSISLPAHQPPVLSISTFRFETSPLKGAI